MGTLLVECDGIADDDLRIAAFGLTAGQAICLAVPYPVPEEFHTRLYQLLSGLRTRRGLQFCTRPFCVNIMGLPSPGLWTKIAWRLRPASRAVDWLQHTGKLTGEQATALVTSLGFPPQTRMDRFPGTPRTLIGLEAAFGAGAKVIVVSGAGLDPLGRDAVLRAVQAHSEGRAIIHVAYPYWCNDKLYRDDLPDVPTVELAWPGSQVCADRFPMAIANRAS